MNALTYASWGRRGAYLLVLAAGVLLVVWAPVPAAYQLAFRAVILGLLYVAMVARLWRDTTETLDCDDPHLSPYCQEQLRRYMEQHVPTQRTAPLTPVQRRYLSSLSRRKDGQEQHRD